MKELLRGEGVSRSFGGGVAALAGVTMTLGAGEIVAIEAHPFTLI